MQNPTLYRIIVIFVIIDINVMKYTSFYFIK